MAWKRKFVRNIYEHRCLSSHVQHCAGRNTNKKAILLSAPTLNLMPKTNLSPMRWRSEADFLELLQTVVHHCNDLWKKRKQGTGSSFYQSCIFHVRLYLFDLRFVTDDRCGHSVIWISFPARFSRINVRWLVETVTNSIWWLCVVPTSTTRFASDLGYRMCKNLMGLYKENYLYGQWHQIL